jgi:hypothetical protein
MRIRFLTQYVGMEITYELAQKDFYESFITHRNSSVFRKWFLRLIVFFVLALLAFGMLGAVMRPYAQAWSNLIPLSIFAALWVVLLWASPWLSARKQFSKQPGAQGPRTLSVDSAGVHWRWSGGSSDVEWKNYIRYLEGKSVFLIYTSPVCFNMVPKRALTPDQMAEFRALLAQNISRGR